MDEKCSKGDAPKDEDASPSVTNEKRQDYSLPREKILRRRKLIQDVFQKGTFKRGRWFDAVSLAVAQQEQGGVAFTTTRRVHRAVDRNLIKRRLREAYRLEQPAKLAHAIVFIGSEKILTIEVEALRRDMRRALLEFREDSTSSSSL